MFVHRAGDSGRPAFAVVMRRTSLLSKRQSMTGEGVVMYRISKLVLSLVVFVRLFVRVWFCFVLFFSMRMRILVPFVMAFLSSSLRE